MSSVLKFYHTNVGFIVIILFHNICCFNAGTGQSPSLPDYLFNDDFLSIINKHARARGLAWKLATIEGVPSIIYHLSFII